MNVTLTLLAAKTAAITSRLLGRGGGGALPGLVAERLDPQLAAKLAAQLPHGVIVVTGTNGKTTTTKLIAEMLESQGEVVLSNRSGSNLKRGVVSALVKGVNLRGQTPATVGLFEVDEASLRLVAPLLAPRHIVVLNLFRDQLDRYGELDTTASLIGEGIAATEAQIYLNADDPLVASLSRYAKAAVHYFGIKALPSSAASAHQTAVDSDRCPICSTKLVFSRVFYGHIGHYKCPTGDFARPQPSITVTGVDETGLDGTRFTVAMSGKRYPAHLPLPGTYNLYNALAVIALGRGLSYAPQAITKVVGQATAAFGRVEQVQLGKRKLYLLLVKNPAGFTQILETFLIGQKAPKVLMLINDNHADGRDVSWLWDVPIESLKTGGAHVWTGGIRGADMALRLKYAGIQAQNQDVIEQAIQTFTAELSEGETGFVLPTYTAMTQLRKQLGRRADISEVKV